MEVRKQCLVCGRKLALGSCKMCGKLVCENHIDKKTGICFECEQGPNA